MDNSTARDLWTRGEWSTLAPYLARCARVAVQKVSVKRLFSDDEIDDFVQRVVIRCWMRPNAPPYPGRYAARAGRHIVIDHWRAKRNHAHGDSALPHLVDEATERTTLDQLEAEDDRQALLRAIEALQPMKTRHCVLFYASGALLKDLAQQFDTTEGAIKMLLSRARAELRDALQDTPADAMRVTVHAQKHDTLEVRVFRFHVGGFWDRIGTMNVHRAVWARSLKPLLIGGAQVSAVPLTIDESNAVTQYARFVA